MLRQVRESPGEIIETDIETHNELRTPHGATLSINESFKARASARDASGARVFGDVKFALALADGTKVDVNVRSEFGESTAQAEASISMDGSTMFHETWCSPQGEPEVAPADQRL